MEDTKEPVSVEAFLASEQASEVSDEKRGTDIDQHDMHRMGKTQETRVCLVKTRPWALANRRDSGTSASFPSLGLPWS